MHTRYFEHIGSGQFWGIALQDNDLKIHQGKIGTPGKAQIKVFRDAATCRKTAEKLIQVQLGKGYSELDLNHPETWSVGADSTLKSIVALTILPPAFLEWAAQTPNQDVQRAIANHPQATPLALQTLAQSPYPDVAELANLHVNLAGETTENWQEDAISRLKALDLNPKRKQVLEVAALGIIPNFLLDSLALELRVAIAKQPETDPQLLTQLADDYHENVRKAIAANSNTPAEVLEKLVGDRVVEVRATLAKNPATPASALIRLADDVYEKVRKLVWKHPHIPGEALYKLRSLAHNPGHYLIQAASDPNLSPETLSRMAQESDWRVRELVAKNPATPLAILEKLANDPYECVCQSVAANPSTPFDILKKLASYGISWVGQGLGSNPNVPTDALVEILKSTSLNDAANVPFWSAVVANPNLPLEIAEDFFKDLPPLQNSWKILDALAKRKQPSTITILPREHSKPRNLPSGVDAQERMLIEIAADPNTSVQHMLNIIDNSEVVQRVIAGNPNVSEEILQKLADTNNSYVCEAIAQNPKTPPKILEQLSKTVNLAVLLAIAKNPNATVKILEHLASHSKELISLPAKEHLANHPNTAVELLEKLVREKNSKIHFAASRNPNGLPLILKYHAQSNCMFSRFVTLMHVQTRSIIESAKFSNWWWERYAIAQNPNTPQDTLQKLGKDPNRLVRAAAKRLIY